MDRSTVSLQSCSSYGVEEVGTSIDRLLEPLGGLSAFVSPGECILLKPNFVAKSAATAPACTHPEVILAVARKVRECGATPVIGDSPALGSAEKIARHTGLYHLAREEGFEILTLQRPVHRKVELGGKTFHLTVSQEALECDGILNLPKFKAHRQATLTFGVKNLYGCVTGKRKPFRHFASGGDLGWFSNMLIANAKLLAPRLTLVDGIVAMQGLGPVKGTARPLGVLVAGADVTSVDSVCCRLVGYPPTRLCTIDSARKLGYGIWDPDRIDVLGEDLDSLAIEDFEFPDLIPIFFSFPRLVRSCLRSVREKMAPEDLGT
jgi:uncharacterized protein (DUF362 family)